MVQEHSCIYKNSSDRFVDNLTKKNAWIRITKEFENITGYPMESAYFVTTFMNEINDQKMFLESKHNLKKHNLYNTITWRGEIFQIVNKETNTLYYKDNISVTINNKIYYSFIF